MLAQAGLLAAVALACALDGHFAGPVRLVGVVVALAGLGLFVSGVAGLGRALTPLPRPNSLGGIVERGVYRRVRHPIYGGGALVVLGGSLAAGHWPTLALAVAVTVFFELKSRLEEAWLEEHHADYAAYRARTPRRLVPWLY